MKAIGIILKGKENLRSASCNLLLLSLPFRYILPLKLKLLKVQGRV